MHRNWGNITNHKNSFTKIHVSYFIKNVFTVPRFISVRAVAQNSILHIVSSQRQEVFFVYTEPAWLHSHQFVRWAIHQYLYILITIIKENLLTFLTGIWCTHCQFFCLIFEQVFILMSSYSSDCVENNSSQQQKLDCLKNSSHSLMRRKQKQMTYLTSFSRRWPSSKKKRQKGTISIKHRNYYVYCLPIQL